MEKSIEHVIQEEKLLWQIDSRCDVIVQNLVANLEENNSTSEEAIDCSDIGDLTGIEEL